MDSVPISQRDFLQNIFRKSFQKNSQQNKEQNLDFHRSFHYSVLRNKLRKSLQGTSRFTEFEQNWRVKNFQTLETFHVENWKHMDDLVTPVFEKWITMRLQNMDGGKFVESSFKI